MAFGKSVWRYVERRASSGSGGAITGMELIPFTRGPIGAAEQDLIIVCERGFKRPAKNR